MRKLRLLFLLLLFLLNSGFVFPQSLTLSDSLIKELKQAGDSILHASNDSIRIHFNELFYTKMDSVLNNQTSFTLAFDSIKNLAVLQSPDKKLRIYNWILPLQRGNEFQYFGFVQMQDKKTSTITTTALKEKKWTTDSAEATKLTTENWYGALYYKILENKFNNKVYYTLLGWHGTNFQSTRKVIDALVMNNLKLEFGAPIFKTGGKTKTRIVFEYNAQATMSLKYDEGANCIVFDHLSPSDPRPEAKGMFSLYGPDMTYDALHFEKGVWMLQKNIELRNNKQQHQKEVPVEKKFRITKTK